MNNIAVCIPTYKRPIYLKKCIQSILNQEKIKFDIVIINNDINHSVEKNHKNIIYLNESQQGIPYVRNKAIEYCKSKYEFIAFIDDDEEATSTWLSSLYNTLVKYNAEVVHGPVLPKFSNDKPTWVKYTHFLQYNSKRRNAREKLNCCSAGNVIFNTKILRKNKIFFDTRLCETGGSDTLFFRQICKKYKTIWCNEAIVYENVPQSRQTLIWNLMRSFREGNASALIDRINANTSIKYLRPIRKLLFKIIFLPAMIGLSCILFYFISFKKLSKYISRMFFYSGYIAGIYGYKYNEYKIIHGK